MANSLQEQLLRAGLVDEKKLRQARQGNKQDKKQKAPKGARNSQQTSEAELARRQQAERSRELNRQREVEAARKAREAQLRQIIEANRLPRREADVTYHFEHDGKVRRIHVTRDQQARLGLGQLGIVTLAGGYELLPLEAIEKVRERDPAAVILIDATDDKSQTPDADDPYAAYQVPDDLMW
ncbi:conserved hypothetical protein [Thioalkalivibrio sulfidiphilus HL-EbGr7]|uniref:Nucleoprotein/polynucleotide-associated enzyme n=1 Tax=Thioalkalivibrio sulfidiphilus (strain HL-EbGR7) TaxID=396588 RepID=B8GLM3_THISH|nr:DUF2058 domain-containing protein [Thioalkalivibrio sulfidiphilus]ACL73578.1 conserved hypothetical protein [Thioalkalivibrio sulfidiphilus HL-EbGr7]